MVYIDNEFKCHTTNPDGTYREIETGFFNGRCKTFIEGHLFVPDGEILSDENGVVLEGKMITPWADYNLLEAAQAQYDADLAEAAAAYQEGVDSV